MMSEKASMFISSRIAIKNNFDFTLKEKAKSLVPHTYGYFTGKDVLARITAELLNCNVPYVALAINPIVFSTAIRYSSVFDYTYRTLHEKDGFPLLMWVGGKAKSGPEIDDQWRE